MPTPPSPVSAPPPTRRTRSRSTRRVRRAAGVGVGIGALTLLASGCLASGKVANDTLTITGSTTSDKITLRLQAGDPNTLELDNGDNGTADQRFDRSTFSKIVVDGGGGNDTIRLDRTNGIFTDTEQTTLRGGPGADTLVGDLNSETLEGGAGNDTLVGGRGNDTLIGGDDDDTATWDPGDGSDVVEGGAGHDHLQFRGANIAERFDVSANGGRVRFTRDIASIAMDLDDVEALDLAAFGGADTVTVGNLTGTDLTTVNPDLAATGGGDDGQVDEIVVPQATTIGQAGPVATVDGLGAQVRVLNGAAIDQVHVTGATASDKVTVAGTAGADVVSATADGTDVVVTGATAGVALRLTNVPNVTAALGDGADQFSATGNLAALTHLTIDGQAGDDTLLGSNGADLFFGGSGNDHVDGNQGTDTVLAGTGDDTVQWDPGDGSDIVEGQAGTDRLRFNGSAINERFEASANGGRVRFTRDIANIVMDLDDVEALDVAAFGGTDTLTVGNLTGTDLKTVTPDFAASGGGDDGAIDEVVVGTGATAGQDGTVPTVDGLGAQVRVVNGSPTDRIHAVGATNDLFTVAGTSGADVVTVTADGTDLVVTGVAAGLPVRVTGMGSVAANLLGGADQFSSTGNVAPLTRLVVNGGDGDDTLLGGNGADVIFAGPGNDVVDGNQGNDTVLGDTGDDTVRWDPGDGDDIVEGQAGADVLDFNGSAIGERFEAFANGGRLVFTRDIGAIVMDVNDVERIAVDAAAGSDQLTVHDLSGTDVKTVDANLEASGGAADGVLDRVFVEGTNGNDTVNVVDVGSTVEVRGLATTVRVRGADATLDRLAVNGLGGNDTVTATTAAGALILLDLVP